VDIAHEAGLRYRGTIPGSRPIDALQGIGAGCAFLDYDHDGNLDILLIGPHLALFRGDGHGHFQDVTRQTGLARITGHFVGCAIGDYDNDGFDDIYVSGYGCGTLLHNDHGHRFTDVTAASGIPPQPWGTSCSFVDVDGDGLLDLYVCNYFKFGPGAPRLCNELGVPTACGPYQYHPLFSALFHNLGHGRFEDVTKTWSAVSSGDSLGVAAIDFDASGRQSIAVANDRARQDLLRNLGGRMENISKKAGTVGSRRSQPVAGMGIDWGDYDNDGNPDLFITTFEAEEKCLYHNQGSGLFEEIGQETGIAAVMQPYVSFGCKFVDLTNDGWLDLVIANGHVQDNIAKIHGHELITYREPIKVLMNSGAEPVVFADATATVLPHSGNIVGRGLAIGDFNNDGREDVLVTDAEGAPLLLANRDTSGNHWLGLKLVGTGRSNRDAIGARVVLQAGAVTRVRYCRADGSYLSSSDLRVLFGLGRQSKVDSVTVYWPDGRTERYTHVAADRYTELVEGSANR
jgi:hypothetical protein